MNEENRCGGGCLCGAVRYEVSAPIRPVVVCHCSQCRKTHGDRAGYTNVKKTNLVMLEERGLKWFRSSEGSRRGFCGECGGSLFFDDLGAPDISVAAGTLDSPTGIREGGHIYIASKGDYYELPEDGLPRFEGTWER